MSLSTAHPVVDDLRKTVAGRVVTPDDQDYDAVRKVLYDFADRHPAAVVRVAQEASRHRAHPFGCS